MSVNEERAIQARGLLRDKTLVEAFDSLIAESTQTIVESEPEHVEERESAYRDIQAVRRVRSRLESFVNDVKVAAFKRRS